MNISATALVDAKRPSPYNDPREVQVSRKNRLSITILLGAIVTLASFGYFSRHCSDSLFVGDAADYVRGAKIGLTASYFDTRSVGLLGAIKIMKQHPEARLHLWDLLQQQDDAAPSRHFHVAPGLYGAVLASQFGAANRTYRLIMAAAGAFAIGGIFIGLRLAGVHFLLALAAAALATVSPSVVYASSNVSPHAPFLAALIASGFAFAQYLKRGTREWGIATGVTLGFAVATCELSIIIFVAFALILVWCAFRSGIRFAIDRLPLPAVALLGTLVLLWPGGVVRGGYVLSYGVFCLQALLQRGYYFGDASSSVVITRGAQGSVLVIVLFVVIVIGVLVLELTRKSNLHIQVFSWLFLGFLAQGVLNRFKNPTYAASFIGVTWILLPLIAQQWVMLAKGRTRYAVLAAACGMNLLVAIPASRWPPASARVTEEERTHAARAQEATVLANKLIPPGAAVLANYDYEILGLYLPQNVVQHSTSAWDLQPRPWLKLPQDYWIIADPRWLPADWRERLPPSSPSNSAGGFVLTHTGVSRN